MLLPGKQLPEGANEGDYLDVFIYRDSEDRLISTTRQPLATLGSLAYLKVTAKTQIGAFLDLGLERGLFLPFREQKYPVEVGRSYLVYVYLDKSSRLSCTTDIYKYLTADSPYQKDEKVTGTVYNVNAELGIFVAVDNRYKGLIPNSEVYNKINNGDIVSARVIRVRDDGKLDLSLRDLAYKQINSDAEILLKAMQDNQGYLPVSEKAESEVIERMFKMSKAAFKRAIGSLLKTNKIVKTSKGMKLTNS